MIMLLTILYKKYYYYYSNVDASLLLVLYVPFKLILIFLQESFNKVMHGKRISS